MTCQTCGARQPCRCVKPVAWAGMLFLALVGLMALAVATAWEWAFPMEGKR